MRNTIPSVTIFISLFFYLISAPAYAVEEITPHKYSDKERKNGLPPYEIPNSSKYFVKRNQMKAPDITFYYSRPKKDNFPIVFFCGGSSSRDDIFSVIHLHRYFLQEFLDLEAGVITLEQWGIDGDTINVNEFMNHYTRTQRLGDHKTVVEHVAKNPPSGWNGKLIFVGVSEGGPLVTSLTIKYPHMTLATVNWSGAGDWDWREELWSFLDGLRGEISNIPWYIKALSQLPSWVPFSIDLSLPETREEYDRVMDQTLENPTFEKEFMGMTYKYHADSLSWPSIDYSKIKTPYLVVSGAQDTLIQSSDLFVEKAKKQGVDITYFRIPDMDHYVRKRPDVLQKSFDWLKGAIVQHQKRIIDRRFPS